MSEFIVYLTVDKDGSEYIFDSKPIRDWNEYL